MGGRVPRERVSTAIPAGAIPGDGRRGGGRLATPPRRHAGVANEPACARVPCPVYAGWGPRGVLVQRETSHQLNPVSLSSFPSARFGILSLSWLPSPGECQPPMFCRDVENKLRRKPVVETCVVYWYPHPTSKRLPNAAMPGLVYTIQWVPSEDTKASLAPSPHSR